MQTMKIGKSGIDASVVGIGAWAIGGDSQWGASDDSESIRMIHRARELGVTLLDTAPAYGLGHSEEVVGKALAGRRSEYVLSTKCGLHWDIKEGALVMERDGVRIVRNTRPARLAEEVETSLRRLKTDYIDISLAGARRIPLPDRRHHGLPDRPEEAGQDPCDRRLQSDARTVRRVRRRRPARPDPGEVQPARPSQRHALLRSVRAA